MSLTTQFTKSNEATFIGQVTIAMVNHAVLKYANTTTPAGVKALCNRVLNDPTTYALLFAKAACRTTDTFADDAAIATAVGATNLWSSIAGSTE